MALTCGLPSGALLDQQLAEVKHSSLAACFMK